HLPPGFSTVDFHSFLLLGSDEEDSAAAEGAPRREGCQDLGVTFVSALAAGRRLEDGSRAVELGGEGLDGAGGDADLLLGLFPVALLQGLAPPRQGLDAVAGIEARGVDLVAEPRAAAQ